MTGRGSSGYWDPGRMLSWVQGQLDASLAQNGEALRGPDRDLARVEGAAFLDACYRVCAELGVLRNLPVAGQPPHWGDQLGKKHRLAFLSEIRRMADICRVEPMYAGTLTGLRNTLAAGSPYGNGAPSLAALVGERNRLAALHKIDTRETGWVPHAVLGWTPIVPGAPGSLAQIDVLYRALSAKLDAKTTTLEPSENIMPSVPTATTAPLGTIDTLTETGRAVSRSVAKGAALGLAGAANVQARDALYLQMAASLPEWAHTPLAKDAALVLLPAVLLTVLDMMPGAVPSRVAGPARQAATLALEHAGLTGAKTLVETLAAQLLPMFMAFAESGQAIAALDDLSVPMPDLDRIPVAVTVGQGRD